MLVRGTFLLRVQNEVATRLLFVLKCVFVERAPGSRSPRKRKKKFLVLLARRDSLALSELSVSSYYIPTTFFFLSVLAMHFFSLTEHMR
jgi:hypothetical protein